MARVCEVIDLTGRGVTGGHLTTTINHHGRLGGAIRYPDGETHAAVHR